MEPLLDLASAGIRHLDDVAERISSTRWLIRRLERSLAEEGLRLELWRVMHALDGTHGMLMGELADKLAIPPGTITKHIDDLIDVGCVFRRAEPGDGRKLLVYLSRIGKDRLDRANAVLEAMISVQD